MGEAENAHATLSGLSHALGLVRDPRIVLFQQATTHGDEARDCVCGECRRDRLELGTR
jgi:hypothetical protein